MDSLDKKVLGWIIGLFILTVLLMANKQTIGSQLSRGLRLNNPGNIRKGQSWQGMSVDQPDNAFIKFSSPQYGFRAMAHIFRAYRARGIVTIRQIITTWAPPKENDTTAYINAVVSRMNSYPDYKVSDSDFLELAKAITKQEQGIQPFDDATILEGLNLP